jgi:major membrane immunogen (membrane-anchored lipoprotein)
VTDGTPVFCNAHRRDGNFKFKIKGADGIQASGKKQGTFNANKSIRKKVDKLIDLKDCKSVKSTIQSLTGQKSSKSAKSKKPRTIKEKI